LAIRTAFNGHDGISNSMRKLPALRKIGVRADDLFGYGKPNDAQKMMAGSRVRQWRTAGAEPRKGERIAYPAGEQLTRQLILCGNPLSIFQSGFVALFENMKRQRHGWHQNDA